MKLSARSMLPAFMGALCQCAGGKSLPSGSPTEDASGSNGSDAAADGVGHAADAPQERTEDAADAGAVPPPGLSELQTRFLGLKYGMFLHFNMSTFTYKTSPEYAPANADPKLFAPTALDPGQWVDAAVASGMKYLVLTAKHQDGFCLWDSAYTKHDVGSSTWKGGKGDVVKEYVDAMRKRGLPVGLYFSIGDLTNGDATTGVPSLALVKGQLTELLTRYGPVAELWFDNWPTSWGQKQIPYDEVRAHIKGLQPAVLVLINNHARDPANSDIIVYENPAHYPTVPDGNLVPSEVTNTISPNWFFTDVACDLKSVADLTAMITHATANRSNFLLDVSPDTRGLIPDCQVQLLTDLKPRLGGL